MALNTLAIDIGKHSFHVFGIDDDGVVISRKVSRSKLATTVECLDPKIVAMEACGGAHHWGRLFQAAGRAVRLIKAYFVKPFVRGSKNDATDAQAIFEAADRPCALCRSKASSARTCSRCIASATAWSTTAPR